MIGLRARVVLLVVVCFGFMRERPRLSYKIGKVSTSDSPSRDVINCHDGFPHIVNEWQIINETDEREKQMTKNEARQDLDRQKMRGIGRVLGFFSAYSELQTGIATDRAEYDASFLCDPKALGNPKLLRKSQDALDPHIIYLKEDDCHSLYVEGWKEGQTQGAQAYETGDLELIGDIARVAGRLAPFYTTSTTAENDARDCKVFGERRTHFIINWRQTGGDRRKRKGI